MAAQQFAHILLTQPALQQGRIIYRLAHFLGQCTHESNMFQELRENLMYTHDRLLGVFPRYFSHMNVHLYAGHPEKIANRAYANRMGNGPEHSGDGYRYRGRGFLQLTGKSSYEQFTAWLHQRCGPRWGCSMDCVNDPEAVADSFPWLSAIFYFEQHQLWSLCDQGIDTDTITHLSRIVNGGLNGLDDRIYWTHWWYNVLRVACGEKSDRVLSIGRMDG